jgi:CDP-6-deoxy-D-xylo-4-hexulose-3-dehydrase
MVCVDDDELLDRALLLRRWGRRSEPKLFGSKKGERRFFSEIDGIEYDDLFIFDEVGWNFEPAEISAAFGVVQMQKLEQNLSRRQRNFALLTEFFAQYPDVFVLPRTTPGIETGWHMFPIMIRPESGVRRAEFQAHMEAQGIDTRMVWTGNVTRQPAFANTQFRVAPGGLANADRVMETGLILPCNHAIDDEGVEYVCHHAREFLERQRSSQRSR